MPIIGDRMKQSLPPDKTGAREIDWSAWFRRAIRFWAEVKEYLEDGTIVARIDELEAELLAITTILLEGVLNANITNEDGESAVTTDPSGHIAVRVYDQRLENAIKFLTLQVAEMLQRGLGK